MRDLLILLFCITSVTSGAQTFTTLSIFDYTDGASPKAALVQGVDGYFYGTTAGGGHSFSCDDGCGTIFRIDAIGALTTLYRFCPLGGRCLDGAVPSGVVEATDGNFYGTTQTGGSTGRGTLFKLTSRGLTTIHVFCEGNCSDGSTPLAPLVQAADHNFYGTTEFSGINNGGTIFRVNSEGVVTTLYSFCAKSQCRDGNAPIAGLVQGSDGFLYGTTTSGGNTTQDGTVFKISTNGKLTTLYRFCSLANCADGSFPFGALVQGTDGNFYGTTLQGGASESNCLGASGCGTVFRITPAGVLTTLYSFCARPNCADGGAPTTLVMGTDGNFYGTAGGGGGSPTCTGGCGTIFEVTLAGELTTLYSFCAQKGCPDGENPNSFMQATNGSFYGVTGGGGANNDGTLFNLATGLGEFVTTLPGAAKVGVEIGILGTDLTGATSVTFNGVPAQFMVKLPTIILAQTPMGATTGTIQVVLPAQTLSSNVAFYVLP
jgi:uncharacterized repeat protein (TIGR03803 family)